MTARQRLFGAGILAIWAVLWVPFLVQRRVAANQAAAVAGLGATRAARAARRAARIAANETATLADIRRVIAAQAAYRTVNGGFYDSRLECLWHPYDCIPFYPANAPSFLGDDLASLVGKAGYRRSYAVGSAPSSISGSVSPSSVSTYRYDATPLIVGETGVRGFAADATGRFCSTPDGTPVSQLSADELEATCEPLDQVELVSASDASHRAPLPDALRVRMASVERMPGHPLNNPHIPKAVRDEPLYSLLVALENTSDRRVVIVGVRSMLLTPGAARPDSDSWGGYTRTIEPGDAVTLGAEAGFGLSHVSGRLFHVLAVRYGDAADYRTNRRQIFVLKWRGAKAGRAPSELQLAPEDEAAKVRKQALRFDGWWCDTGPEQTLPADWSGPTKAVDAPPEPVERPRTPR